MESTPRREPDVVKSGGIGRYDFADALRGLAILGVMAVHSVQVVNPAAPALDALMRWGAHGVQLFFVVSAFTLYMSWESRSPREAFPVRNFFIRRFFRIAPPFYLAIAGYLLLYGMEPRYWAPNGIEWWFVLHTVLFINGFHPETINSVVPGGWSITAEVAMYTILPLLFRYVTNLRAALVLVLVALVAYLLSQEVFAHLYATAYPPDQRYLVKRLPVFSFFGQLPVFAFGICMYFAFARPAQVTARTHHNAGKWCLAAALSMVALLVNVALPLEWRYVAAGAALAVFAFALAGWPVRVFVNRITTALGKMSYSMYLWQFAVSVAAERLGLKAALGQGVIQLVMYYALFLATVATLSWFSYRWVELPSIDCGRRLIERLQRSSAPVLPA